MRDKIVVVTGATSMIGREIAQLFSDSGATLVLISRSAEKLQKLSSCLNTESLNIAIDVTDAQALIQTIEKIIAKFGRVDCLIQNTGIYPYKFVDALSLEEWNKTLMTNLTAHFITAKTVIPIMKQQKKGKIIFISSIAGELVGLPGMSAYTATKAGLNGFMRSLAIELAAFNINVNSISPGKVYDANTLSEEEQQKLLGPIPLKRFVSPCDIAHMAEFLVSPAAVSITGQNIVIDGGQSILAEDAHIN